VIDDDIVKGGHGERLDATRTRRARYIGVRTLLREPKPPYDKDDPDEKTPPAPARRSERCRVCRGTGRIHLVRGGKDVGRARRCPACRGAGFVVVEPP
jgi:hypothetical protein